jgi:rifampicin phosphotransferase
MDADAVILDLATAGTAERASVGGKAGVLGELATAGFPVLPGVVVTAAALDDPEGLDVMLADATRRLGVGRFAVRSSGAAEDLPEASYAGLYETYLNVTADDLGQAVRRCFAAATAERVSAYHQRHSGGGPAGMAVLVQPMLDPVAAGVAFTAHPITGDRDQTVVTAVAGLGDPLVSGEAVGEEWTITARDATVTRPMPAASRVLTAGRAQAVADLARRVADRYGRPQDIEWAVDRDGRLWLLQARPMTAVPDPVSWAPPGPGLWMRNLRLGEWLPEAVTPLFGTWLLPVLEDGFLDGMQASVGVQVPFRYALVNGWYYNATPIPSPMLLARVLRQGRGRAVKILYNALIRVSRDPVAADRAVLSDLDRQWREHHLPAYRRLVGDAGIEVATAAPDRLVQLVDRLGYQAGIQLWYLAIVGGSAWKMEACLTRFCRQHLAQVLPDDDGGAQVLLRGLPGNQPVITPHAVQSVDWYHLVAAELPTAATALPDVSQRHAQLTEQRANAEDACRAALAGDTRLAAQFEQLLRVNQRYAVIREEQARDLTLAWPVLRACVRRLGEHLVTVGAVDDADDVFFCTREETTNSLAGETGSLVGTVHERRNQWQHQRALAAPLTLGHPMRLIGDVIERAAQEARGPREVGDDAIVGHPASAGRATGPVRIVHGPHDFAAFRGGDVLVAKATAPAWTPLFARAAAVVTDGGTLAAHASLVAREYAIPAVVGTGDATQRLHPGQLVTVDGSAGTVTPHNQLFIAAIRRSLKLLRASPLGSINVMRLRVGVHSSRWAGSPANVNDAHAFFVALLEHDPPSLKLMQSLHHRNPRTIRIIYSEREVARSIVGLVILVPLTQRGMREIEDRQLTSTTTVNLERHVSKSWRRARGAYIGGVAGSTTAGRAWALSTCEFLLEHSGVEVVYARPASKDGLRVMRASGFVPLGEPSQFWKRPVAPTVDVEDQRLGTAVR